MAVNRKDAVRRRHNRIRRSLSGTPERPRMAVYRSHQHIYVQVIDDVGQVTVAAASSIDTELKEKVESGSNQEAATKVGKLIAERAIAAGVKTVVFDRGGNLYHGRVKALADAAREAGLDF